MVFGSIGTAYTSVNTERHWLKLVHRATYVRNRNPKLRDQRCRLKCGAIESMLHLMQCRRIIPLWKKAIEFCVQNLETIAPRDRTNAIIFGVWKTPDTLGPEPARAFLRIVYGKFYHDFMNVDFCNSKFKWQYTFHAAIAEFRTAALALGHSIRIKWLQQRHSEHTKEVDENIRSKHAPVLIIQQNGSFTLHPNITTALNDAKSAVIAMDRANETGVTQHPNAKRNRE